MLMIISPAKTLDFQSPLTVTSYTQPELLEQAEILIEVCRQFTPAQLASLMKVSDKLAGLNAARFAEWQNNFNLTNARQALFAFKGDVYTGLHVEDFNQADLQFSQHHLRILSGLYGLLKPLDLMQPYRLEMGTPLQNIRGKDLYHFWGTLLTEKINQALALQGDHVLINLASDEYFNALQPNKIDGTIIKPVFLDQKNGQYKIISFYAKKARGFMSRFIIKNRLTEPKQLTEFNLEGYWFDAHNSTNTELIFKREEQS